LGNLFRFRAISQRTQRKARDRRQVAVDQLAIRALIAASDALHTR
jgi:hypothetical protein